MLRTMHLHATLFHNGQHVTSLAFFSNITPQASIHGQKVCNVWGCSQHARNSTAYLCIYHGDVAVFECTGDTSTCLKR